MKIRTMGRSAKTLNQKAFEAVFCENTADARRNAGFTQQEIATVLGIERDLYKQYEKRNPLPHHMIPPFCIATRISPSDLYKIGKKRARAA